MSDNIYKYFSRVECLKGREVEYPMTPQLEANLSKLLTAVNQIRVAYNKAMYINSLYRPGHYNSDVGGAPSSTHLTCEAVDIKDSDRAFAHWCMANLKELEKAGLYMEDPRWTVSWIHLTTKAPGSGKRVFIPNSSPATDPDFK